MKKKLMVLASTVLSLVMSCSAFAALDLDHIVVGGYGDVVNDGALTALDSANILQYTLDRDYAIETASPAETPIDRATALARADVDFNTIITSNDAAWTLQRVLDGNPLYSQYADLTLSTGRVISQSIEGFEDSALVIDVINDIINDAAYEAQINNNLPTINRMYKNIKFKNGMGVDIALTDDAGWAVFKKAFEPITIEGADFDSLRPGSEITLDYLKGLSAKVKAVIKDTPSSEELLTFAANIDARVLTKYTISIELYNASTAETTVYNSFTELANDFAGQTILSKTVGDMKALIGCEEATADGGYAKVNYNGKEYKIEVDYR